MAGDPESAISTLLERVRAGDPEATSRLLDVAYGELRGLAHKMFGDQHGYHTLQPTALVNEVCMKLLDGRARDWNDREHFFRVAAKAMRRLLIDHARAKRADKRGGDAIRVTLNTEDGCAAPAEIDLVMLDDLLVKLTATDERLSTIFELRFLVGLSVERTAEVLGVSTRTVELDSRFIRAWLRKELHG